MKILQVCKKFPYPLKDGESVVVTHLARALDELGCEVTLLTMNTTKHYFPVSELPADFDHYRDLHAVRVDNGIHLWGAVRNLFEGSSYHAVRFQDEAFRRALIALLQRQHFDVVQLETPFLAPYIPDIRRHSDALVVMRSHNVEHEIWERYAANRFWPLRWYLREQARRLKAFELEHLHDYDLLVTITQRDLDHFRQLGYDGPAFVTPVGLDIRDYVPDIRSFRKKPLSACFIGSLDWLPNQEGLEWLLTRVWPLVLDKAPEARLHIAGRNMPGRFRQWKQRGVVVEGEVPSATEFINAHSIMVAPLFSGSGMRVKILEGMALAKAVVTTPLGLEGIEASHEREVLLAEAPEAFAQALITLMERPEQALALGERARKLVHDR
ncbi:MAG: glycosyltransferase, partial [Bacteroidetes bacterium]